MNQAAQIIAPSGHHTDEINQYVKDRYESALKYYRSSGAYNRRAYKSFRILTVVLGSLVTLVAAMAQSDIFPESSIWSSILPVATPILAAIMTILAGLAQSFQWGSGWQNMTLAGQRMQQEYDRYLATPPELRDHSSELDLLNSFMVSESESFFERLLGGSQQATSKLQKKHREPVSD